MFAGGNFSCFVASYRLITVEVETKFGLSRNPQNSNWKRSIVNAVDLQCEWSGGERGIERRRPES